MIARPSLRRLALLGFIISTGILLTVVSGWAGDVELVAVGDVMLSRGVGQRVAKHGVDYPFAPMRAWLQGADLSFANLECVLTSVGDPMPRKEFTFRASPESALGLQRAGVDVVSLANNHTMDYGPEALLETTDLLAHHGIAFAGAGRNARSAHRAALLQAGDLKVAFLAYTENFYLTVEATEDQPGAAVIREAQLRRDIKRAKRYADVVVVSFHWGWEYSDHPTEKDRQRARLCIDSGADLVLGHHPHVIQGVERYKHGLISYSLGNFVFDQKKRLTQQGLLLRCRLSKQGVESAEFLPVAIHLQEYRPYPAEGAVADEILDRLIRLSRDLNTSLERTPEGTALIQLIPTVAERPQSR